MKQRFVVVGCLLLVGSPAIAQSSSCRVPTAQAASLELAGEIARHNAAMSAARMAGDAEALVRHFAPGSVVMPEHQVRLHGAEQALGYYRTLFSRLRMTGYSMETAEILPLENGALEWGTFEVAYAPASGGTARTLDGKYMQLWRRQDDGKLRVQAEVFGFLAPLGDAAEHWIVDAPDAPGAIPAGDPAIGAELEALNAANADAVRTYSTSRIEAYAPDAVYLPYADRPQVGLPAIRAHLVPYIEAGRGTTFDEVRVGNAGYEAIGGYVVEYSNFEVRWRAGEASGVTSGDGLRLWRREADCSLSLLRQAGIHHRP